jgi:hypothetical protein
MLLTRRMVITVGIQPRTTLTAAATAAMRGMRITLRSSGTGSG